MDRIHGGDDCAHFARNRESSNLIRSRNITNRRKREREEREYAESLRAVFERDLKITFCAESGQELLTQGWKCACVRVCSSNAGEEGNRKRP
jgi:hypothetical protein